MNFWVINFLWQLKMQTRWKCINLDYWSLNDFRKLFNFQNLSSNFKKNSKWWRICIKVNDVRQIILDEKFTSLKINKKMFSILSFVTFEGLKKGLHTWDGESTWDLYWVHAWMDFVKPEAHLISLSFLQKNRNFSIYLNFKYLKFLIFIFPFKLFSNKAQSTVNWKGKAV